MEVCHVVQCNGVSQGIRKVSYSIIARYFVNKEKGKKKAKLLSLI